MSRNVIPAIKSSKCKRLVKRKPSVNSKRRKEPRREQKTKSDYANIEKRLLRDMPKKRRKH